MKSIKQNISVFILVATLFAPKIEAMGVWPKVRQVAVTVAKNPNLRTALTQTERGVANTAARTISRTTSKADDIQPVIQNISRSFATQVPKAAQQTHRSTARSIAAVVGLAGAAIGGGLTYAQAADQESQQKKSLPKDFLMTTNRDILETMLNEDRDYARQFAELVTAESFGFIDCFILYSIIEIYPTAAISFAPYALAHLETLLLDYNSEHVFCSIMEHNPEAMKQYTAHALAHIETLLKNYNGIHFLGCVMKYNPEAVKQCAAYALAHIETLVKSFDGIRFLDCVMKHDPEMMKDCVRYAKEHIEEIVTDSDYGAQFLNTIMGESAARDFIASYVLEHVGTILKDQNSIRFFTYIMSSNTNMMKQNSELVKAIACQALAQIEELMGSEAGVGLLSCIMECNPETAIEFASYALDHLETLIKDEKGVFFLNSIKKHDPEVAKELISYVVMHIEELIKEENCIRVLYDIMENDPEEAKALVSHGLAHVEDLVKHESGAHFLRIIMDFDTEAAKVLVSHALTHVETLIKDESGQHFLTNIMWYALIKDESGQHLLTNTMWHDVQAAKAIIVSQGLRHIEDLVKNERGLSLLIFVIDKLQDDTKAIEALGQYVIDNFGKIEESVRGRKLIKHLAQYPQMREKLIAVSQAEENDSFIDLMDQAKMNGKTQTDLHLAQKNYFVKRYFGDEYDLFPGFRVIVKNVIALEKEYGSKGYYTFVHAQQWPYHMTEALYRRFKEITLGAELPYFRYMFTKKEHYDESMQQVMLSKEERMRREIIMQGREKFENHDTRSRQLFLNAGFFGNTGELGSSSAHYLSTDSNVSAVQVSLKDMFAMYGQEMLYEKYKPELDVLEKEHKALSKGYGNMLVVAVPKDKISDYVVQVAPGGYLTTSIVKGKETSDIRVILDALATDPSSVEDSDRKEFVLAMTDTAGLDPKSGIKMYSVSAADPEKMAAWQEKFDALIAKITPEFKIAYAKKKREVEQEHRTVMDAVDACRKYAKQQK